MALSDEQLDQLRAKFGRVGVVHFEGHEFVFQQPNQEHGRFFRRGVAANDPDVADNLAAQLIVAMDGEAAPEPKEREPLRLAFRAWLKTRPLAMDNAFFAPVLSELLGQVEEGGVQKKDGCRVLSSTPTTSLTG